jgi:hypothetical protein
MKAVEFHLILFFHCPRCSRIGVMTESGIMMGWLKENIRIERLPRNDSFNLFHNSGSIARELAICSRCKK